MAEITAVEIERQARRMDEQNKVFFNSCVKVILELEKIQEAVTSADSNLGKTIDDYQQYFMDMKEYFGIRVPELTTIMHEFAAKTIANEEQTASQIDNIERSEGI